MRRVLDIEIALGGNGLSGSSFIQMLQLCAVREGMARQFGCENSQYCVVAIIPWLHNGPVGVVVTTERDFEFLWELHRQQVYICFHLMVYKPGKTVSDEEYSYEELLAITNRGFVGSL